MKLSISMLAWYLRDQNPVCHIVDDDLCIEGLRFVMDDVGQMMPKYLYFGEANLFFSSAQYEGAYIGVNRHSMLIFPHSDYNTLLNGILSAFEFFTRMEGELMEAASSNAPLVSFMKIMEPVLENPFLIGNADCSYYLATDLTGHKTDPVWEAVSSSPFTEHPAVYAPYYDSSGQRIVDLSDRPRLVKNVYEGGEPVMMLYLQSGGENVGTIAVLQENHELTTLNMQLVPILAKYCVKAEEFILATGAIQSGTMIFQNLLEGTDVGELNQQRLVSFLKRGPWRLLQLRLRDRTDQFAKNVLLLNLRNRSGLYYPLSLNGTYYTLISEHEFVLCIQGKSDLLKINGVDIGASMPFTDFGSMEIRRQQAQFALDQAQSGAGIFLCEDYACEFLLSTYRTLEVTKTLLHPALDLLEQYDRENQGEMAKTLSAFLENESNQIRTAQAMHIHPNTLRYRLQRITEITGLNLTDSKILKYLRLSDWLK